MIITVVSDVKSWINDYIPSFLKVLEQENHSSIWVHDATSIPIGDLAFYLSFWQLIPPDILKNNRHNLVVHESTLPKGKGWSPLTWQIIESKNDIPIALFEAVEQVDSGDVYIQDVMHFKGTELIDEIREIQAIASIRMCLDFVRRYPDILKEGKSQQGKSTFYSRRRPNDSRLDPDKTIREQFNLLRVVDNERYPAFFELSGETYILEIKKKV